MIEKRASLLARVVPDVEVAYAKAISDALDQVYERLNKLQVGYSEDRPDNTWTRERLTFIFNELAKELGLSTKQFSKLYKDEFVKILQIDNAGAVEDFNAIVNLGHTSDEVTPYSFKLLTKKHIYNILTTDYLTFTYLGSTGVKKYSSLSVTSMLKASELKTLEQVRSILTAGAINGRSPASIVNDLRPINQQAKNLLRTSVRTLLADASNLADFDTLESNREFFEYYQFIAVLDNRTSAICRTLDGKQWKNVPEMYKPPLHPNCRSKVTPIPKGFKAGTRPLVLPDGSIEIIDGNLTYADAIGNISAIRQ